MRFKRLLVGAVSAGLLGLTPLALAPANAGAPVETHATITSSKALYTFKDRIFFDAAVTTTSTSYPYAPGSAHLYMQAAGSKTWKRIATDDGVSYLYFPDLVARQNALYKVVYPGGTDTRGVVYSPSQSAPFRVKVQRKVTIKKAKKRLTIKGKVAPAYKRKKVVIHRKKGKRWVKHRKVKTNKKSVFTVKLPAAKRGKRLYFRITVPKNKKFVKYSEVWYTYSYRGTTPRASVGR